MTDITYFSGSMLSLSEDICNRMLANISKGVWKEGDKIPSESALCEMFNASRVSIRSAIKLLQGQGFLITRPGIGSFVSIPRGTIGISIKPKHVEMNQADCRKYVDFRLLVEGAAMRLFPQNATAENHAAIETAVNGMRDAAQDIQSFIEYDMQFHMAIFEGCKNEYLYNAMQANYQVVRDYFKMVLMAMEEPFKGQMYERHKAIYEDLYAHNVNGAILRLNTELNYCYVEIFDKEKADTI